MSSNPNDRQVGGTHYQDAAAYVQCPVCKTRVQVQHWDLFAKMPYLMGQVCKYVMRFLGKNGRQDLQKARHFLDKLEAVYYPEDPEPEYRLSGSTVHMTTVPTKEEILHVESSDIEEVRRRADAFAAEKPNNDVPPGWILEEASVPHTWHYRRSTATGSSVWSAIFTSRATALAALYAEIPSMKT